MNRLPALVMAAMGAFWTLCHVDVSFADERKEPELGLDEGWALVEILKNGVESIPYRGDTVTLRFDGRRCSGSAGVNRIDGTYSTGKNGAFHLDGISMTEMAAADGKLMAQENVVAELLMKATQYEIEEGKLLFLDAAGKNGLRYTPNLPPPAIPVKGIVWELAHLETTVGESVSAESPEAGKIPTVRLGDDSATGTGGLVEFSAPCEWGKKGGLKIGAVVPKEIREGFPLGRAAEFEAKYFKCLPKMTRFSVEANRLTLSDEEGNVVLHFKAAGS